MTFLDPVCSSDCPLIAAQLAGADRQLGALRDQVEIVAIDTNPVFAHVADVAAFTESHGLSDLPNWHFVCGPAGQVSDVLAEFGIAVDRPGRGHDRAQRGDLLRHPGRTRGRLPGRRRRRADRHRVLAARSSTRSGACCSGAAESARWSAALVLVTCVLVAGDRGPGAASRTARPQPRPPPSPPWSWRSGVRLGGLAQRRCLGAAAHRRRVPARGERHTARRPDRRRARRVLRTGPASRWRSDRSSDSSARRC